MKVLLDLKECHHSFEHAQDVPNWRGSMLFMGYLGPGNILLYGFSDFYRDLLVFMVVEAF